MNTRVECSPRIIKRINTKEKIDDASKYDFYRQINHLSIMRLDNEADKLNYSSWLTRLDSETSDLKMDLIKILFISLRSDKSFQMFLKPPPDDLKDLELNVDNTMDMVKWLQDNNKTDESLTNEEKKQEINHKRSAAVATNMRSYTTIKTSPYFVQSFYVRSDWPIYTWYNPSSIRLPSNFDHNQWELFLNRFQIITEKNSNSKHRNECDDIIPIDQISKEVATTFNWHPYSILASEENRPKRTAGSIVIDLDISNQQCNQKQIDEAAFAIVFCKEFPGNKIISRKMYFNTLIPDAKFIFKMTGVTLVNYSNIKLKKPEKLPFTCELKKKKRVVKNSCEVKIDKTPCPCEKPMMTIPCRKPQLQCSTEILAQKASTVNTQSDCKFSNPNTSHQECKSNSKCLMRSVKKTKSVEPCKFPKQDDDCLNAINDHNEPKQQKNRSTVLNAGGSSFNDSSNCDWTVSCSFETMSTKEPDRACSGNVDCASTPSDLVTRVEPEDLQSAPLHCSCSSLQRTVVTLPHQGPKTAADSVRERPRERHRGRRRSIGDRDGANSERTAGNGRRADAAIFRSGRRRGQRTSTRRGLTSDDGQRVGQRPRPAQDLQNHPCSASFAQSCRLLPPSSAFAEHRPSTAPRRPDTSAAAAVAVSSCSDRRRGGLQQQHESAGPSGDNTHGTTWNPDMAGSFSAFSATIHPRSSTPLPANDYHGASAAANDNDNDNDDLSDDCGSGEASRDWSDEPQDVDQCRSWTRVMWTNNRFGGDDNNDGYDNNNNNNNNDYGDTAGSLFTSSEDGSIEMRRTDERLQLSTSDDERYTNDGVSVLREDAASAQGSSNSWPWSSSSMSDSKSDPRVPEFDDVRAPDRYDGTSCSSEGGNVSAELDDYRGETETDNDDDGGADAAPPQSQRNY